MKPILQSTIFLESVYFLFPQGNFSEPLNFKLCSSCFTRQHTSCPIISSPHGPQGAVIFCKFWFSNKSILLVHKFKSKSNSQCLSAFYEKMIGYSNKNNLVLSFSVSHGHHSPPPSPHRVIGKRIIRQNLNPFEVKVCQNLVSILL